MNEPWVIQREYFNQVEWSTIKITLGDHNVEDS